MSRPVVMILCLLAAVSARIPLRAQDSKIDSLKALLRSAVHDTVRYDLYGRIAWAYLAPRVELDLGRAYADTLQQAARENRKWKMRAHYFYGAYERFKANHDAAVEYLLPYVNYYTALGDSNWVADGLFQLASVYNNTGDFSKSVAVLQRIIAIDRSLKIPTNIAHSLNSLGVAYFNAGRYDEAITAYEDAAVIYDSLGIRKSFVFLNLGNVYTKTGDFDNAKKNYNRALQLDRQDKVDYAIALDLANIAYLHDAMHQYDSALAYHLEALKIRMTQPDKEYLTRSLIGVARGYRFTGNVKQSDKYYRDALKLAGEIQSKPLVRDAYGGLAELNAAQRNFEEAFHFLEKQKQIHDSIFNEDNSRQINELHARYESEKKNRQIAMLENEALLKTQQAERAAFQKKAWTAAAVLIALTATGITIGARQRMKNQRRLIEQEQQLKEAQVRQQLTELELKALKAQINPHFFFNCMNSINRLILDGNLENASRYLTKFSKLVRSVLENSDNDYVSLEKEIEMLGAYVTLEELRLKEKILYSIQVDEAIDLKNTFLPPMILQPFVENAIWHGLAPSEKPGGVIKVRIQNGDDSIRCSIEDNGIGREKARTLKTGSVWKTKSMGMKITEERLRLLNQEKLHDLIRFTDLKENEIACGTRVEIRIPVV